MNGTGPARSITKEMPKLGTRPRRLAPQAQAPRRVPFVILAPLLGSGVVALLLLGAPAAALGLIAAGGGALVLWRFGVLRTLLLGTIALCAIPPARMEERVLEYSMSQVPKDLIVRSAYYLMPGPDSYYPEVLLLVLMGLLWLTLGAGFLETIRKDTWVSLSLLLFVLIATASFLFTVFGDVPFRRWLREYIPIMTMMVFFPLARWMRTQQRAVHFSLWGLLAIFLALVVHSLYGFYTTGFDISVRLGSISPYNNLPFAGIAAAGIIPFLIRRQSSGLPSWLLWVLLAAALGVVLLTETRILIIAVPFAFAFNLLAHLRVALARGKPATIVRALTIALAFGALVAFLSMVVGAGAIERFMGGEGRATAEWRVIEIEAAWSKFLRSPVYGNGLGSPFVLVSSDLIAVWYYIHNAFMYYLADLGLLGLISWAMLWLALLRNVWGNIRRVPEELFAYFLGFAGILLTILVYSLVQSSHRTFQNSVVMGIALAGVHACISRSDARGPARERLENHHVWNRGHSG